MSLKFPSWDVNCWWRQISDVCVFVSMCMCVYVCVYIWDGNTNQKTRTGILGRVLFLVTYKYSNHTLRGPFCHYFKVSEIQLIDETDIYPICKNMQVKYSSDKDIYYKVLSINIIAYLFFSIAIISFTWTWACVYVCVYTDTHIYITKSDTVEHLGCFCVLAIVLSAVMHIGEHKYFQIHVLLCVYI